MARHHYDGHGGIGRLDPFEHFKAVHPGHLDVEKHKVGRVTLDQRQPFGTGRRSYKLIPLIFERAPYRLADARIVIDHENSRLHRQWWSEGSGYGASTRTARMARCSRPGI